MTITNDGKLTIKRYLAKFVPDIAQSIAFGIGNTAESVTDTKLQFEAGRVDILLTSLDLVNNRLVYKATLPDDFGGTIYEAGLFSTPSNSVAGQFGSKIITTFDSGTENWLDSGVPSTFATGNSRIGTDSLVHSPATSGSQSSQLDSITLDLSGYSSADKFVFAFNCANGNTASIKFIFMTDSANYYTITLGAQTSGYKIVESTISSAVATGTPSWDSIASLKITTTATSGGAASVQFDGIRVEDVDTVNPDYVLVSREVLATPYTKAVGRSTDIEFYLDIVL